MRRNFEVENLGTFRCQFETFFSKKTAIIFSETPTGQQTLYHVDRFQHSSPRILSKI